MAADEDEDEDEAIGVEEDDGEGGGPGRVAKSERILNLIAVLLRADGPVPVTDILGKVTGYDDKASRDSLMRRFERDKKVLREMGVPIEHAPAGPFGGEGYTISRDAFFLDEVRLPPESGKILRALFAWAHAGGGELSADLRAALVKLGYFVEDDGQAAQPARAREHLIEPMARPGSRRGGETVDPKLAPAATVGKNLELLSEAVMRQRRVKLKYFTYTRSEETVREVDPYGLGYAGQAWNKGAWYLVGYCHLKKDLRCFKVARIRGDVAFVKGTDEPDFQIPAGFRVREHVGKTRWEFQDLAAAFEADAAETPFTARVRFEAPVATEVRALAPSARVVSRDAERETLELAVRSRRPFLRFLLRYVPKIEILEPADLDDELRALAREVLALYEAPPAQAGGRS